MIGGMIGGLSHRGLEQQRRGVDQVLAMRKAAVTVALAVTVAVAVVVAVTATVKMTAGEKDLGMNAAAAAAAAAENPKGSSEVV
jgi:hypothetical protein